MWSPHFDSANFLVEAFPRAAAVAERLWSKRSVTDVEDARARLHDWRCRLLRRGLPTGPVNGGVPSGASGHAPPSPPTTFGGAFGSGLSRLRCAIECWVASQGTARAGRGRPSTSRRLRSCEGRKRGVGIVALRW